MAFEDVSVRKFKRKVRKDGAPRAVLDAAELLTRKYLAPPVYDALLDRGTVDIVTESELFERATRVVHLPVDEADDHHRQQFVAELDGGYVLPVTGLSFTQEFGIVGESVAHPEHYRRFTREALVRHDFVSPFKIVPALLGNRHAIDAASERADVVAPFCPRYRNYYHWTVQTLPRLRSLRRYERETGREVTLVVPPDYPPWLDETLSLLDWPSERVRHGGPHVFHADTLVVPSFPGPQKSDLDWLRRELLSAVDTAPTDDPMPNVFISRERAVERRIVNHDVLSDTLSKYGVSTCRLEDNSVAENIRRFNNADVVIGAHGAGLTDIVFCEDCAVVELFGSKVKPHYEWIAETLGLEYYPMHCEARATDLFVDVDDIERLLSTKLGDGPVSTST
jgi:hypothetical protein